MKKRITICIFLVVILFLLCGCKDNEKEEIIQAVQNEQASANTVQTEENQEEQGTLTKNLLREVLAKPQVYLKYKTQMDLGMGEEEVTVSYALMGDMEYIETASSVSHVSMLETQEGNYTIMHDQKVYMRTTDDVDLELDGVGDDNIEDELEDARFTSGKENINGVEYDYEEMFEDGEYSRFYYNPSTRLWEYWKIGDNQLLKIEEYRNKVDESLFQIPEGYEEVTMP